MKQLLIFFISFLLLTLLQTVSASEDPIIAKGKQLSQTCVGCHGPTGIAPDPSRANLKGQHELYLVNQMKAFKAGTRKDPTKVMNMMMLPLSEEDMKAIARYYNSLGN